MLENIKSLYAFENILKYIKKRDILNILDIIKYFKLNQESLKKTIYMNTMIKYLK